LTIQEGATDILADHDALPSGDRDVDGKDLSALTDSIKCSGKNRTSDRLRPFNHKNSADRLMQLVKGYSNIFTELVEIYQKIGFKDRGLLGQWRRAIHSVEAQIAGMNRADMQASLLQLRILETVDLKAVTVSKNYVDKIIESMVLSPAI